MALIRVPARRNITAGRTAFRTVRLNGSGTRRCVFAGGQTSRAPRHRRARWPLSAGFDVPHSRRAKAIARGIFRARHACICKWAVLRSGAGERSERLGCRGSMAAVLSARECPGTSDIASPAVPDIRIPMCGVRGDAHRYCLVSRSSARDEIYTYRPAERSTRCARQSSIEVVSMQRGRQSGCGITGRYGMRLKNSSAAWKTDRRRSSTAPGAVRPWYGWRPEDSVPVMAMVDSGGMSDGCEFAS